jgi:hypothetical protein
VTAPLVIHIVHRFDFGGFERGLVNHKPVGAARQANVAMSQCPKASLASSRAGARSYRAGMRQALIPGLATPG